MCPELTAGSNLGHFTILERIGTGGMGVVFRARDDDLEREVAIKVLPFEVAAEPRRLARFDREAKALARISHRNILAIHEFGEEAGVHYVVTELLEGRTLKVRLGERPMTLKRALEVGAAIADGLAAAHSQGIVHRDVKPGNVFLTAEGGVKILDFGLARTELPESGRADDDGNEPTFTQTGAVLGTPGYMSPEQVRGRTVDARSDIFSFGCMLYEMTTGLNPFKRDTSAETMTAILKEDPPEVDAEPELKRLLSRCLEKNPNRRFQTAPDLAFALRSQLEDTPSEGSVKPVTDQRPFVAVLPFANLTGDTDQEYFCDGMAEEIINALAQVSGLRVVARTSAFAFKRQNQDVREIGRRLDVSAIVEGSVRMLGDRLRITAQLIDARDGLHLWSGRFDRTLEDVFEIQDEISLSVVDKLEVELLGREREAVVRRPTDNLEAYNACLRGWYHFNSLTPEGFMRSFEYFNQAIELDPDFAWAYQGVIGWYQPQVWWFELPTEAMLEAVTPLVDKLSEIDESYISCQNRAYMDSVYGWDWAAADEGYRRALEFGPNVPDLHLMVAQNLLMRERFDEAVPHLRKVQELDPLSPLWNTWASAWLSFAGLHDEALAGVERAVELHPHHWMSRFCLSFVQARMGLFEESRTNAELALEMSGGLSRPVAQLAILSYQVGDNVRGSELFVMLQERAERSWVPPTILGWLHLIRGEVDEAYERFAEGARRKDPLITSFRIDSPVSIPDEPRFDALSERLGLPH